MSSRLVRVRLDEDRLHERLGDSVLRAGRRPVFDRQHTLGPPRNRVQAGVRRDLVKPGAQRAAALEPGEPAPRADHRLLQCILGVLDRAEHPVAVSVQLAAMRLDQIRIGPLVAGARRREQLGVGHGHAPGPPRRHVWTGSRCRLRLPQAQLTAGRRGDHAAPSGRALPRLQQHGGPQLARTVRDRVDRVHLDVREPPRRPRLALRDATADPVAEVHREVGPRIHSDALEPPAEQAAVERAGARGVARVQLKMDDAAGDARLPGGSMCPRLRPAAATTRMRGWAPRSAFPSPVLSRPHRPTRGRELIAGLR